MEKVGVKESQQRMFEILIDIDRICKENNLTYWLDQGTLIGAARHKGFIPWDDDLDLGMYRIDYNKFLEIADKELNSKYVIQTPLTDDQAELASIKVRDLNSEIKSKNNKGKYNGLFVDIFPYDDATKKNIKNQKRATKTVLMRWFSRLNLKKPIHKNLKKNIIIAACKIYKISYLIYPFKKRILNIYYRGVSAETNELENKLIYGIESPFKATINKCDIFPTKQLDFEGLKFPVPNNYKKILEYFYGDWTKLPDENKRIPSHSDSIYLK